MEFWTTLLVALFGGAGSNVLIEGYLKPRLTRRRLARALAEEAAFINEQSIEAFEYLSREPSSVPSRFDIPTPAFDALAAQLGELEQLADIIELYTYVRKLTHVWSAWRDTQNGWIASNGTRPSPATYKHNFEVERNAFIGTLGKVIEMTAEIVPALRHAGGTGDEFALVKPPRTVLTPADVLAHVGAPRPTAGGE